jgi:hypothetical protein
MPKRHGLFRWENGSPESPHWKYPCFLVGIHQFFYGNRSFLKTQEEEVRLGVIAYHFRGVLDRLLHSLDMLQRSMAEYSGYFEQFLEQGGGEWLGATGLNASIQAEGVFSYLNMLIDDIARLVPLVFNKGGVTVQVFSGDPKEALLPQRDQFPEIEPLLNLLDDQNSWWHLAFKRKQGIRQRIVHYPDLVLFHGSQRQGEERVEMCASLSSPDGGSRIDYFDTLRRILEGFCNWLDQLEEALIKKVQSRSLAEGLAWAPLGYCPRVLLPIEKPIDSPREISDKDFLYIPVCEGSSSIKCTFHLKLAPSERLL